MLRPDDFLKGQLVLFAWRAGKEYGGHLAAVCIMYCLANRQRLGWGSWMEILESVPKHSATIEQPSGTPQVWEPQFNRLLHEVDAVFDGTGKDLSNGALYWADLAKPISNEWFKEKIIGDKETHKIVSNMNSLTFFR